MNQRIIWLITGLIGIAVIGVMSLQMKFISDSREEKENLFDNHIRNALKNVAKRIEDADYLTELSQFANGYSRVEEIYKALEAKQIRAAISIEERINLPTLDKLLKMEFQDRGINIFYNYGIFSNTSNSFIAYNNHYVIPEETQIAFSGLKNSKYQVNLFSTDIYSPGKLTIVFPGKERYIWEGLWNILLLSLLFVAVILGCFAYTITVIFRQKKLSEMKTDFINNMTHEFKTPIATISLAADSITNASIISNPDKVRRFADIIKQENKRMNGQVEKVLQMALIERDTMKLNFSSIDLHEVIHQAIGNISLQVEKKDGNVSSNLNAERPIIEGDSNHISNIINNLLDNANKYSPENPEIVVSTRNVSNGVEITIADKGIGMTKEAKKRIFEKFYRVHTGNLHDVKGFGLGLAYVKTMVTAHKGSIDVKSELGKGSSFIIFLPFHVGEITS
jgi:two-component system, OmpR family, phosphate regulon sensor histidine kinase PhoR